MKCLVTGGAGFIGAHVANELVAAGHQVVVFDDLSGGFKENINKNVTFIQGSVTDVDLVRKIFEAHKFDYVFHLAAYAAEGLSHFIRHFNYQNNLVGSINLINESIKSKVKCFVFTSSIAVYGAGQLPMTEDTVPIPEDPYGISKYAVELDLKTAHEMFGLNYIVFRPHNVYGEYQNIGDPYRNVIGIFMNQLMQGKELTVFGDGSQTRAFSYIKDVAPYIARSVFVPEAYNQVFNIGADKNYSVKELAETVMKAMGLDGKLRFLPARNEVLNAYSDHTKAKRVFDIEEGNFTTLEDGLNKMASWAKEVGVRKSAAFKNIEILENLPGIWQEI
ncbi:MAG TPA: NAD-dependent epimerase/dehydratase family protein [Ginsengibacter sp.]|nr:NAD-dependent epimerase/dehydratase family protein [Ginsengibacter sp.]HRP43151.1 NAD-dependent epimerase/dehydratase family protein [Ginsengibacter sp.]